MSYKKAITGIISLIVASTSFGQQSTAEMAREQGRELQRRQLQLEANKRYQESQKKNSSSGYSSSSTTYEEVQKRKKDEERRKKDEERRLLNEINAKAVIKKPETKLSKYDHVYNYNIYGLANASLKGKWGFIDRSENEVVPVIYDELSLFYEGLACVSINGKYGYVDTKGKVVIPLKYDKAWGFHDGKTATVVLNNKQTIINKNGIELFPFKYETLGWLNDGLIQVWLNKKTGFVVVLSGKEVIPVKYDSATHLVSGGKKMFLNGLHYYFDKSGNPAKNVYDYVMDSDEYEENFVRLNYKWGKTGKNGNVIIPVKYDKMRLTENGMTAVYRNGKWGFVNRAGKEIIQPKFDSVVTNFNNKGIAVISNTGNIFSIDKTGKITKSLDGLPVEKVENRSKPSTIAADYDEKGEPKEGLTAVGLKGKYGFINNNGVVIISLKYDQVISFENGLASVQLNKKWGVVNKSGKEVVALKYDMIDFFSNGLAGAEINGKWGFINARGIMVIKPQYDYPGYFNKKGEATVIINDVSYWISKTGKILRKNE